MAVLSRGRRPVLVYDPYAPGTGQQLSGWPGWVSNDWQRFYAAFWANKGGAVYVDEAARVCAQHETRMQLIEMLTNGRHVDYQRGGGGHSVTLISQRFVGVDKTAREQCEEAFIFRMNDPGDAEALAIQFGTPRLATAPQLPKLAYFYVNSAWECKPGRLTFPGSK